MITLTEKEFEHAKLKAIQDHLLSRGLNDEEINEKLREIENP